MRGTVIREKAILSVVLTVDHNRFEVVAVENYVKFRGVSPKVYRHDGRDPVPFALRKPVRRVPDGLVR